MITIKSDHSGIESDWLVSYDDYCSVRIKSDHSGIESVQKHGYEIEYFDDKIRP